MRHGLGSEHAGTGVNGSGPQVLSGGRKAGAAAPPANVVLPGSPGVDSGYGFGYEGDSKIMQDSIGMMEFSPNESEERAGRPANGEYGVQSMASVV
uniref:Uncharacterized protein n=1 Tax=Mycena chlorophos TaxID=658473 RepID=A0ABQ0LJ72_MYCCL|nr:predicted protein [Mycena chlorophos]